MYTRGPCRIECKAILQAEEHRRMPRRSVAVDAALLQSPTGAPSPRRRGCNLEAYGAAACLEEVISPGGAVRLRLLPNSSKKSARGARTIVIRCIGNPLSHDSYCIRFPKRTGDVEVNETCLARERETRSRRSVGQCAQKLSRIVYIVYIAYIV